MTSRFDAIVVGAGQAGPSLAGRLAEAGMHVALIERGHLGGTCVNTGCTPTKALVASARVAHVARRAADFGVTVKSDVAVDFPAVQARQRAISAASREGLERWIGGMDRCTLIRGHARFVSPSEIEVGDQILSSERIFLNVGARAQVPDMPGIRDVPILTNSKILALDQRPAHLVVVGGSYIGLEFAQMFRRFGSAVTVVERGPRLIGREDPEVSDAIRDILEREGIQVRLEAECIRFERRGPDIAVGLHCDSGAPEVIGTHALLAVGRQPNTDDLGLDRAGVTRDPRGYISVDDQLRTNVPGVYALGDCNGRGAFTHTAYNDFEIVAANLLDGSSRSVADRIPAYALYIDPPLGRAGLSEAEARKAGFKVRIGARPMTRVSRAVEKGETQGLMKVVVDVETDRILGAAVLGPGGDEAVHGLIDMMSAGMTASAYRRVMPIHPTLSELIPTILGELGPAD